MMKDDEDMCSTVGFRGQIWMQDLFWDQVSSADSHRSLTAPTFQLHFWSAMFVSRRNRFEAFLYLRSQTPEAIMVKLYKLFKLWAFMKERTGKNDWSFLFVWWLDATTHLRCVLLVPLVPTAVWVIRRRIDRHQSISAEVVKNISLTFLLFGPGWSGTGALNSAIWLHCDITSLS